MSEEPGENPLAMERHLSVREVAELWGLHPRTIHRIFEDRPGVLKLGGSGRRGKRDYLTLRIPVSLVEAVHRDLSTGFIDGPGSRGLRGRNGRGGGRSR